MSKKQMWKMYYRWTFLGTILIGSFWLIYYIYNGYIPYTQGTAKANIIFMSYAVSRLWDLLIFPLFSGLIMFFLGKVKSIEVCEWIETVFIMSFASAIMGLIAYLTGLHLIIKVLIYAAATFVGFFYILFSTVGKEERRLFEWWFSAVLIAGFSLGISCGVLEMVELYLYCFLLWLAETLLIKIPTVISKIIAFVLCKTFKVRTMHELGSKLNSYLRGL